MEVTDENNLSCFSEIHRSTQLHFISERSDFGAPCIPVTTSAQKQDKNYQIEIKAQQRWLCKFFHFHCGSKPHTDRIPLASGRSEALKSQAVRCQAHGIMSYPELTHAGGLRAFHH